MIKTEVGGSARYHHDYYFQRSTDIEKVPGNPWIICTLWIAEWEIEYAKTIADLEAPRQNAGMGCQTRDGKRRSVGTIGSFHRRTRVRCSTHLVPCDLCADCR